MQNPKIDVVVPAAGVGRRMQLDIPKQYVKIGNITILEHTLKALLKSPYTNKIVVGVSADDEYFDELEISKDSRIIRAVGGSERSDTVRLALSYVTTPFVMVHDAARPFISTEDLEKLSERAPFLECGAILACRVADTIKQVAEGRIIRTVPRQDLYRAYTPQLFKTELLRKALDYAYKEKLAITDDASALELLGYKVEIIEGRADNIKLTLREDLILAEMLLNKEE